RGEDGARSRRSRVPEPGVRDEDAAGKTRGGHPQHRPRPGARLARGAEPLPARGGNPGALGGHRGAPALLPGSGGGPHRRRRARDGFRLPRPQPPREAARDLSRGRGAETTPPESALRAAEVASRAARGRDETRGYRVTTRLSTFETKPFGARPA